MLIRDRSRGSGNDTPPHDFVAHVAASLSWRDASEPRPWPARELALFLFTHVPALCVGARILSSAAGACRNNGYSGSLGRILRVSAHELGDCMVCVLVELHVYDCWYVNLHVGTKN